MPRDENFFEQGRSIYQGPVALPMSKPLAAALGRYHPALRRRVRSFAATGRRCADLAISFPAAAALIVTAERGPEATGLAVCRVKVGAPLPSVAEALELPFWTRKLPPEAFGPEPIGRVEGDAEFARGVGNALPKEPAQAAMWLAWVLEALRLGGEEFALWLAAQPVYEGPPLPIEAIEPLAAFRFASAQPGARKDPLLVKLWGPRRPFATAAFQAATWLDRVLNLRCAVSDAHLGWDEPSRMSGFRFEPLKSAEQLIAEGEAMGNCLGAYVGAVGRGDCLIYAVRRGKASVANLEIRPRGRPGEFYVAQLEGPRNTVAPSRVQRTVQRWAAQLGPCPLNKGGLLRRGRLDAKKWRAEWAPFVAAHPAVGPLWREAEPEAAVVMLTERLRVMGLAAQRADAARRA